MDRKLEPKPWYARYAWHIAGAAAIATLATIAFTAVGSEKRLRVGLEQMEIATVVQGQFREYVDVEGIIHPIQTIQVNAREDGNVERIIAEDGAQLSKGDTILILSNPDLVRHIEEQHSEWERQNTSYKEKELEMEQQSLNLKQQALDADYELSRLSRNQTLNEEEYKLGIQSEAQLQAAREEYAYKQRRTQLQRQSIAHDSAMTIIRKQLLRGDLQSSKGNLTRARQRLKDLAVCAPISGQLSFVRVNIGQKVAAGSDIAELKVVHQFKIRTSLSEYYIDRIAAGLPASIKHDGKTYPLKVSKAVPEVKDRMFQVELTFAAPPPPNARLGKSYRIQIELGQPEDALVIKRGNFYSQTGGKWLFRLNNDGNTASRTEVSIGRQNPQQYEVLEGLKAGDKVIISGYNNLKDVEELIINKE